MAAPPGVDFRVATGADVPAMALCRRADPAAEPADPRMAAYFSGDHHPAQALPPRTGYVASNGMQMIGYIAGHRTTRHDCDGELQYLFVARDYRRRGVGREPFRLLAEWFRQQGARSVCVGIADDSPPEAKPFVERLGASPLKKHWYAWKDL